MVQLNIDGRLGRKVIINIPIFKDINTPNPFIEKYKYFHKETEHAIKPDHIYMDAYVYAMGSSCLQVTFQTSNPNEARQLYDQLAPITSIMLAISASAPIFRGYLSDIDSRWSVLKQGNDDRTKQEKGEEPIRYCDKYKPINYINLKNSKHEPIRSCECGNTHFKVPKSRYDSISLYISELGDKYNNQSVIYNIDYYEKLIRNGVDNLIALHIAHLFTRDSVGFSKKVSENETELNDNFENIQSTVWQSLRFKPPPKSNSTIGWRIEFRVLDLQITDFENSAYAVFIILLTRVILKYNLNLLIPMSKVEDNMNRSDRRDAVNREKFWFRKNLSIDSKDEYEMMTIDQIMNGNGKEFIGLIKLIRQYLIKEKIENEIYLKIDNYLNLISDRSTGKCLTNAKWIRDQIQKHPDYKFDSVITDQNKLEIITNGGLQALAKLINLDYPNKTSRLVLNCLWTIRNLSDSASDQINIDDLLLNLVRQLQSVDSSIVICSACILGFLIYISQIYISNKLKSVSLNDRLFYFSFFVRSFLILIEDVIDSHLKWREPHKLIYLREELIAPYFFYQLYTYLENRKSEVELSQELTELSLKHN